MIDTGRVVQRILHGCVLWVMVAALAAPASADCEGDWLVDPDATGAESQTFLDNFYALLTDLTHEGGPMDPYAVHRFPIDGQLFVTAPWFSSSTECTGGVLHDRIGDGPVIIAEPSLEHYLVVTDELSELAWVVSLGTSESESLMMAVDRTVLAMGSTTYGGLPCWIAEVREDVSPPTITCQSQDTATDGTVRLGLAYYNAANNPHFSSSSRDYFRQGATTSLLNTSRWSTSMRPTSAGSPTAPWTTGWRAEATPRRIPCRASRCSSATTRTPRCS